MRAENDMVCEEGDQEYSKAKGKIELSVLSYSSLAALSISIC